MNPVPPARTQRRVPVRTVTRWLLLIAVAAGIFGMHVLTAEGAGHGHGLPVPASSMAGPAGMATDPHPAPAVTPTDTDPVATPGGHGSDTAVVAGCILFLAIGAAALIAALLRSLRGTDTTRFGCVTAAITHIRRRAPPRWPRVALCVVRI